MPLQRLRRYAWLSIAAALITIALKTAAWWLTASVGLLSDALESAVNLAGALMALAMLTLAARPPDAGHAHGHSKAEYFSSAFEGLMIFLAALLIGWAAVPRLFAPRALEAVDLGLVISLLASLVNLGVGIILLRVGRRFRSITLEADARHLLTDVWTSAGVIVGIGLAWLTGWLWLDPLVALLVAVQILWTGWQLLQRSAAGLMDVSLPAEDIAAIKQALEPYRAQQVETHALMTRQSGARAFVSLHVLTPGSWTVALGHDWCEQIEADILRLLPHAHVTTHLEAKEDPRAHRDRQSAL